MAIAAFHRSIPAAKRPVDVPKGLFGGGIAQLAEPIENAPGLGLLLAFIAEEGVLHRDLDIVRLQLHGLAELVAGQLVLANL